MNPHFHEFLAQVQAKAPRAVAQMAHYHRIKELDLPKDVEGKAIAGFCMVECATPPPKHPEDPDCLAMQFDIEVGEFRLRMWTKDDGELTDNPSKAMKVPRSWKAEQAKYRAMAYDGIKQAKDWLKAEVGIPRGIKIYDNLPS